MGRCTGTVREGKRARGWFSSGSSSGSLGDLEIRLFHFSSLTRGSQAVSKMRVQYTVGCDEWIKCALQESRAGPIRIACGGLQIAFYNISGTPLRYWAVPISTRAPSKSSLHAPHAGARCSTADARQYHAGEMADGFDRVKAGI